eukprot:TRINITY_DN24605_c0_g1_i1.p1 TRINITY_DN24605_c0_g1~~TRINITY_DN24605_c0_g1_i1.p1  ORF type:complete len:392 (+),score=168.12 TRINITY_DN24605_c0_g1_i1:43-1176(+)
MAGDPEVEKKEKEENEGEDAEQAPQEPEKPPLKLDRSKTLWENIAANPQQQVEHQETNLLVVGSKRGGKSTLIQRFVKRDDSAMPKATAALEYCHGRREDGKKVQTAHFWEVGGGSELHCLMDVAITPENLHSTSIAIVVDLSDPRSLWSTLFSCIDRVNRRLKECCDRMRAKKNTTPDRIVARHKRKIGENHPDIGKMHLNGIPTVIVGTKYDLFADNPHTKVMAKTLRYIAHMNGMHLIWTSSKDEKSMNKYRALMANIVFQNAFPEKYMNLDYSAGPLLVWPGKDSLELIGPPIGLQRPPENFQPTGDAELDRHKQPFDDAFPPKQTQKQEAQAFTNELYDEFAESAIDAMRKQKDEEFRKGEQKKKKSIVDAA